MESFSQTALNARFNRMKGDNGVRNLPNIFCLNVQKTAIKGLFIIRGLYNFLVKYWICDREKTKIY